MAGGGRRDDLEIVVAASTEQLASDLSRAAGMLRSFAKQVEKTAPASLSTIAPPPVAAYRQATSALGSLSASARGATATLAGMARQSVATAAGIAMYSAGVSGLSSAVDGIRDSVRLAADLEQTQLAFEVMLGSADRANRMITEMRQFAATTPFNSQEVTAAARSLIGYGVAADQVIPTVKMLGDVSAAFGKDLPLARLNYLYGTLFAQQRAYTIDIKQFATAGIPIWKELEKVTGKNVAQLHKMVEEGRIGRDEITQVFLNMTSAGGKFFEMTKRQADTVAGAWEAASDAWQLAKTQFGKVIIEETGLKEQFRNFDAFAKNIEAGIAAPGSPVRQAVRFIGDLTKTIIQGGYEIGRFTAKWVELRTGGLSLPDINSKEWGIAVAEGIVVPLAGMVDDVERFGGEFADAVKTYFLDPLRAVRDTYREIRDIGRTAAGAIASPVFEEKPNKFTAMFANPDLRNQIAADKDLYKATANFGPALADVMGSRDRTNTPYTFRPIQAGESPEKFAERYRMLDAAIGMAQNLEARGVSRGAIMAEELLKFRQQNFIAPYGGDSAALHQAYLTGRSPAVGKADDIKKMSRAGAAEEIFRRMRAEDAAKIPGAFERLSGGFAAERQRVAGMLGGVMPFAPAGLRSGLGASEGGVKLMGDVPSHLADLAARIKDELNPLDKVLREKSDLDAAAGLGLLTPREAERAHAKNVQGLAEQLGIGGTPQLAGAALAGTAEDARLLAAFRTGAAGGTKTENLLEQIRDYLARISGDTKAIEQAPAPRPVEIDP